MHLIQIVPNFPPSISGVGDYAFLIAKQLRAAQDIHTVFVVCDTEWKAEDRSQKSEVSGQSSEASDQKSEVRPPVSDFRSPVLLDGFPVYQLKEQSAEELLRVLAQPGTPTTVLLHYVGYGYAKRGCPVWLVRGLEKWRKQKVESRNERPEVRHQNDISEFQLSAFSFQPPRRLLTMFHEVSASGPVWSSAFWTSPVQQWIARSLARLSDHGFTNLNIYARILQKFTSRNESEFTVLPVFSNMGEPEQLPDWNERKPRMIVFGSASQRRKVYLECKADLEKACQCLGLNEIVDIGAPLEIPQLSVRVSRLGILSAQEVGREMLIARAGFFAYPTAYLGKSTIFAAYAAHGLVPVTFDENRIENGDGLILDAHFVSANFRQGRDVNQLKNIGKNAREWYGNHSLVKQAYAFGTHLF